MTNPKRYKRYSGEFKREAMVRASEEGVTDKATCDSRKITAAALDMWITRRREFSHIPTAQPQQPFPYEIRW